MSLPLQMTVDQLLQLLLIFLGVTALVLPMHLQNRATFRKHMKMAKKAWRAINRHETECTKRWAELERKPKT